ncbi:hypothetical protein ACP4OV_010700 [Aristida adscensionis]
MLDAKERKKQRERERYARNKEEILRKQRERYHEKKAKLKLTEARTEHLSANPDVVQLQVESGKENLDLNNRNDWLHRDDVHVYMRPPIGQRSINTSCDLTPITMVDDDVNSSKIANTTCPIEELTEGSGKENLDLNDSNDWLHRNDVYMRPSIGQRSIDTSCDVTPITVVDDDVNSNKISNTPCPIEELTGNKLRSDGQVEHEDIDGSTPDTAITLDRSEVDTSEQLIEAKRAKWRAKYASLSDQQKKSRRERQALRRSNLDGETTESIKVRRRVENLSPKKKQSIAERRRLKKELKRNMLRGNSIAMQNPSWVPEPVFLPSKKSKSSSDKCSEFIDHLEYKVTPIHIPPAPKETNKNVEDFDMTAARRKNGRNVPVGERQAFMARQNKRFRKNIRRVAVDMSHEDTTEDMDSVQNDYESMPFDSFPLHQYLRQDLTMMMISRASYMVMIRMTRDICLLAKKKILKTTW